MPSELQLYSTQLKTEAESILQQLDLIAFLSQWGEAKIAGSVALDLIVKPDIDIHLMTNEEDLFLGVDHVYRHLIDRPEIQHVHISDYRINHGIKIGVYDYVGAMQKWSVDIWITNKYEATGFSLLKKLTDILTPEQREHILRIKNDHYQRGDLFESLSTAIYYAVVRHGVKSVAEFKKCDVNTLLREGLDA